MSKYTRIEKIRHFAEKIAKAIPEGQSVELDNALGAIEYLTSERYKDEDSINKDKLKEIAERNDIMDIVMNNEEILELIEEERIRRRKGA